MGLGALVQANSDLFNESNELEYFGCQVVTADEDLVEDPWPMVELAHDLFANAKEGVEPVPEELRDIVEEIRSERPRPDLRRPIPEGLLGNDRTWLMHTLFAPADLPRGRVERSLWPVLHHETLHELAPRVPHRELWWTPEIDRLLPPWDEGDEGPVEEVDS